MSRGNPEPLEELAVELECSYCEADPGEWCHTKGGGFANLLHGERTNVVRRAWHVGFKYGYNQGYNDARGVR